jgi:hypothetical protein
MDKITDQGKKTFVIGTDNITFNGFNHYDIATADIEDEVGFFQKQLQAAPLYKDQKTPGIIYNENLKKIEFRTVCNEVYEQYIRVKMIEALPNQPGHFEEYTVIQMMNAAVDTIFLEGKYFTDSTKEFDYTTAKEWEQSKWKSLAERMTQFVTGTLKSEHDVTNKSYIANYVFNDHKLVGVGPTHGAEDDYFASNEPLQTLYAELILEKIATLAGMDVLEIPLSINYPSTKVEFDSDIDTTNPTIETGRASLLMPNFEYRRL